MTRPAALRMALAAGLLAACATPPAELDTATQQRCRTEARLRATAPASTPSPGPAQAAALSREQAFYEQCITQALP
jgi:hypothetical protein